MMAEYQRLTKWDKHNEKWLENHDNDTKTWKNGSNACMAKLAAYEDTGLSPDHAIRLLIRLKEAVSGDENSSFSLTNVMKFVLDGRLLSALDKLAAYESTGLSPGDVRLLADEKEGEK